VKPLLTMEQVCILLTISRPTLTRWVRANKIPYVLLGSGVTKLNVRFREEEIEGWIERRSRGPVTVRMTKPQPDDPPSPKNATNQSNQTSEVIQ
jgi:excisionase family DNA binding protein